VGWCKRIRHCVSSPPESNENAETQAGVARTGQKLTDPSEGLLRRVRRTPRPQYNPIADQTTGRFRAPAAAFEPRFPDLANPDKIVDEALSVNVESFLRTAGLPLTWGAEPRKHYVARVTVADCTRQDLEARHDPILPENPHHGLIWGLVEMHQIDEDRYERAIDALARASTIVPYNA
jgi:hypothetical protein